MFKLESKFKPFGDQPKAIEEIVNNFKNGKNEQILLGATGTGKTFTICNVIERVGRPTLVLAHNKTLAGNYITRLNHFSPIITLSILFPIMIIINQRLMWYQVIPY